MVSADSLCVRITLCNNEMPVYDSAHWSISGLDGFRRNEAFTEVLYSLNHLMSDQQSVLLSPSHRLAKSNRKRGRRQFLSSGPIPCRTNLSHEQAQARLFFAVKAADAGRF
jgi:hypothetical protein